MRTMKPETAIERSGLVARSVKVAGFRTDESGSLTIFSLFLFVLLLFISGMAVDMIHQEQRRVGIQNTLDSAVLAASSLDQNVNAETLVKDYVSKAGFDPQTVTVSATDVYSGNGAGLYSRQVTANAMASSDSMFMTFSITNQLGGSVRRSSLSRRSNMWLTRPDFVPPMPAERPAWLRSWQGKPPVRTSMWGSSAARSASSRTSA